MARTIEEIKKEMTDAFMADETLHLKYGFDKNKSFNEQFSKASLESILFYIVACSIWVLEKLFDKHQEEVSDMISKRAHTLAWYREKALNYQYNFPLKEDVVEFDNEGKTENEIENSKIVKKCSCESVNSAFPSITIKVATANGKLSADQKSKFEAYMKEIADAGLKLTVVSKNPDKLGLLMTVLYDPLIVDGDRKTINVAGEEKTVGDYINEYLSSLDYNGDFYPQMLERYLMSCPGVKVANISKVFAKAEGDSAKDHSNKLKLSPVSGAFVFDNTIESSLDILYKPFSNYEE